MIIHLPHLPLSASSVRTSRTSSAACGARVRESSLRIAERIATIAPKFWSIIILPILCCLPAALSGQNISQLSTLTCASASVTGSFQDPCLLTLSGPAPQGGLSVVLRSNHPAVSVPASVTIPADATSVGFYAAIDYTDQTSQGATLIAVANWVAVIFDLNLVPSTGILSPSTKSLSFGNAAIDKVATMPLTLTDSGTLPMTLSGATVTGSGFSASGVNFPVTLNPGQAVTLSVAFNPASAGTVAGQITISSTDTSSTISTVVVTLTGTGVTATQHNVNLSWESPSNSTVPIEGYHVYRGTGTSSSYSLLSSTSDTQTTYTDSTVQSGQTYMYYIKSVSASGVESDPSNTTTVTIP